MKRIVMLFVLGMLAGGARPASAQEELSGKLARIDAQIAQKTRELNYLTVACYIDYARQSRIIPTVMSYPGLDYRAVCDTVPEIKALGERFNAADEAYVKILKSDRQYEAIHAEYQALKGVSDQKRKDDNLALYNQLYGRLRKNNPAYVPALEARTTAMRERNIALVELLLDAYKGRDAVMPTQTLFKNYSDTRRALVASCPELSVLESELSMLRRLRNEVYEQLKRQELDLSAK